MNGQRSERKSSDDGKDRVSLRLGKSREKILNNVISDSKSGDEIIPNNAVKQRKRGLLGKR